jgi:hypothetical protein
VIASVVGDDGHVGPAARAGVTRAKHAAMAALASIPTVPRNRADAGPAGAEDRLRF